MFLGQSGKQDGHHCLWIAETFFEFFSSTAERNLPKQECPLPSLCFRANWKRPLICWDIFNFSETTEQNFLKLDRKQELNILYKVCVFQADRKSGFCLAETFSTSLKLRNWICQSLTGSKNSRSSTKFVFFGPIGNTRWTPWPLIGWDIFDFSFPWVYHKASKFAWYMYLKYVLKMFQSVKSS